MAAPTRWYWKVLHFPLTRIILAVAAILACIVLESIAFQAIGNRFDLAHRSWFVASTGLTAIVSVCLIYAGYVRLIERRPVSELSRAGALAEFGVGSAIGFGLFSLTILCLWIIGSYHVTGWGTVPSVAMIVNLGLVAGFIEEILMRGVIFRIIEESLGTWIATLISALLFGFLHMLNPHATVLASLAISIEAGILLAAVYVTTRRLWLPIGLHFAWNLTQGAIFGVNVSGNKASGILKSTLTGPDLISGGQFGAEASIFAVLICSTLSVYLMLSAVRNGRIIPPFWARTQKISTMETEVVGPELLVS